MNFGGGWWIFFYFCPKLSWGLAGVLGKFHFMYHALTAGAGQLHQVILLVWPNDIQIFF